MTVLPAEATSLLLAFAPAFPQPPFARFTLPMAAALLTTGRRTVANLLRTVGEAAHGHRTSQQRVFAAAAWSGLRLACLLSRWVVRHFLPNGLITLVGDDRVDGHPGQKVDGKARHREAVRCSHCFTAWRYGHQGVARFCHRHRDRPTKVSKLPPDANRYEPPPP